jgi:4-amino-4-deoxy-L-arabinose transferase-like glycosyltransferase
VRRLGAWAQRLESNIDARPAVAFLSLSLFYLIAVYILSCTKLLWLDELITLHIARLPNAHAIWGALARGADPNPPLTHLLVHASRRLFGEREFALRLPAVAGYWLGMASLFAFLRRRVPAAWALAGVVLSMAMAAFEYSYESRSYGIFYGFAMAAVLCWSITADAPNAKIRRLSLLGMGLALALGVCTNYFAVLAFLPVAAGEIVQTYRRAVERRLEFGTPGWSAAFLRAVEWRVWLTMIVAALPLLAFRPLIARSIAQFAPYAWNKVSLDQVTDSYTEMVEVVLYPILALLLVWFVVWMMSTMCANCRARVRPRWLGGLATRRRSSRAAVPVHEAVAILFLMAYPILGYVVASVRGGMLSPRFVIPVCFGFAIAGTLAAFRIFRSLPGAGAIMLCACIAWFVARESYVGYWYVEQRQCFYKVLNSLPQAEATVPAGGPIVIADPLLALTFQHYAPPELASRIVFPVDFPAIRLYRHDDSPEQNLWAGRGWLYTLPVVPLADFQHSANEYVMIASDGNWMDQDLLHHRYPLWRLPINTRAGAIGGFTPLMHGTPVFYRAVGDAYLKNHPAAAPIPFQEKKNLPGGKLTPAEGGPFPGK